MVLFSLFSTDTTGYIPRRITQRRYFMKEHLKKIGLDKHPKINLNYKIVDWINKGPLYVRKLE